MLHLKLSVVYQYRIVLNLRNIGDTNLPATLSRYQLKCNFNTDQFGVFYHALPSETLEHKHVYIHNETHWACGSK